MVNTTSTLSIKYLRRLAESCRAQIEVETGVSAATTNAAMQMAKEWDEILAIPRDQRTSWSENNLQHYNYTQQAGKWHLNKCTTGRDIKQPQNLY